MTNQFTGCECGAPTPDRCICDAMDRVVATSDAITVMRSDGRWIDPSALQAFLRRHNPDHPNQPAEAGVELMADGGQPAVTDRHKPASDTVRHSFRSDALLQDRIDKAVARHGYMDNSEFIREAVRTHLRRVNGRLSE